LIDGLFTYEGTLAAEWFMFQQGSTQAILQGLQQLTDPDFGSYSVVQIFNNASDCQ
jgi:hypothetical protein